MSLLIRLSKFIPDHEAPWLRLHLLLCCAAGDQQGAQLLRLSGCALRCRGALLLRSPVNGETLPQVCGKVTKLMSDVTKVTVGANKVTLAAMAATADHRKQAWIPAVSP